MAKRMRVDGVHADALAEILDDLPDALTRHAPGLLLPPYHLYWTWNSGSLAAAGRSFARYSFTMACAKLWQRNGGTL